MKKDYKDILIDNLLQFAISVNDPIPKECGDLIASYFKQRKIDSEQTTPKAQRTGILWHSREDNLFYFTSYDSRDDMFRAAAEAYCFADCSDDIMPALIIDGGQEVHYTGWQPDMVFSFVLVNDEDEVVWEAQFPSWQH